MNYLNNKKFSFPFCSFQTCSFVASETKGLKKTPSGDSVIDIVILLLSSQCRVTSVYGQVWSRYSEESAHLNRFNTVVRLGLKIVSLLLLSRLMRLDSTPSFTPFRIPYKIPIILLYYIIAAIF